MSKLSPNVYRVNVLNCRRIANPLIEEIGNGKSACEKCWVAAVWAMGRLLLSLDDSGSLAGLLDDAAGLLDDAAGAVGDEVGEVGDVFACAGGDGLLDGGEGVGDVELGGEQGAVGGAEFLELGGSEALALEADFVEAVGVVVALDAGEGVGQHVLGDGGAAADVAVAADAAELVDGAEGADGGVVFDGDVAGESGGVGEDAAVADGGVVADVGVGHDEAVAADAGDAAAAFGAAGDGDVLADGVVVADVEAGGFAGVFEILRGDAEAGEGEDAVVAAHGEVAGLVSAEDDVRDEFAVFAESDVGADDAVGADGAACGDLRAFGDDGGGVDAGLGAGLGTGLDTHSGSLWGGCSLGDLCAGGRCRGGSGGDAGDDHAGDGGLADHFAFYGDDALHLDGAGTPVEDGDFDAELVAGDDGALEFSVVDAGEDHELGVAVGNLVEQEGAAGLGDGFDHEDAGHDGVVGEVTLEVGLVDGDVFDGDDALLAFDLEDAVDEEEGVAVGEEGHDLEDVHGTCCRLLGWGGIGRGGGLAHSRLSINGGEVAKVLLWVRLVGEA
jgi:hypothetical protein